MREYIDYEFSVLKVSINIAEEYAEDVYAEISIVFDFFLHFAVGQDCI